MTAAVIILAAALVGVVIYARSLDNAINAILDQIADTAQNEAEFRRGLKKEMTKLHAFCADNEKAVKELAKKQDEFDKLADESVRAQIESEKAWAEGVRAIAGYGASVPTLNTRGIGNE